MTTNEGVTSSSSSSSSSCISITHSDYHLHLDRWLGGRTFDHVYVGSFSQVQDDLSQWRGYADNGAGVAIGFDLNAILAANENVPWLQWTLVEYDHGKQ